LKEEEIVSLVTLLDDEVSSLETVFMEGVSEFGSFIRLHSGENGNFFKESFIFLTTADGRVLHDVVEGVPVKLPQETLVLGLNRSSTRGVIQKCKFAKGSSRGVRQKESGVSLPRENFSTFQVSAADNIETVALVSLLDDNLISRCFNFLHGADDDVLLRVRESSEHERLVQLFSDSILAVVCLLDHFRLEVFFTVPHSVCFSTDRNTRTFVFLFSDDLLKIFDVVILFVLVGIFLTTACRGFLFFS
jgi:hypothetical protein